MFAVTSLYPVMVVLNALFGGIILLVYWKKRDLSGITWAISALLFSFGFVIIAVREHLPYIIGFPVPNLVTTFAVFLQLYSLQQLLSLPRINLLWAFIFSLIYSLGFIYLNQFQLNQLTPIYVGVILGATYFWVFYKLQQHNIALKNNYVKLIANSFLISSIAWVVRTILSQYFNFTYASDSAFANWLSLFLIFILILIRHFSYISLRLDFEIASGLKLQEQALNLKLDLESKRADQALTMLDETITKLIANEQQLRHVLDVTGDGIWDWNIKTGQVTHNFRWIEMLDEDPKQKYFSVDDFKNRIHIDDLDSVQTKLDAALKDRTPYEHRYRMLRGDGRMIWVEDKGAVVEWSSDNKPLRMVGAISDITEQVASHEKIKELVYFDHLTQLPNRKYIQERLDRVLRETVRSKFYSGLIFLDLDNFKGTNDHYGHLVGDLLLKECGQRLQNAVRPTDVVARLGGDEFLILVEKVGLSEEAARKSLGEMVERILDELRKPFHLEGSITVSSMASIGIVIFGDKEDNSERILKHADLAMYAAKRNATEYYCFFNSALEDQFLRERKMHLAIEKASQHEEYFVEYQPVVDSNRKIIAYESLARWSHSEMGTIMPNDFIPFAETSGQIVEVGDSILKSIFTNTALWKAIDDQQFLLFINISPRQMMNVDFYDRLMELSSKFNVPLSRICFEVTENIFLSNVENVIGTMKSLHENGVTFILDDFGTGYSSFSYLQKFPIQFIKVDKSFVQNMLSNEDDLAIVRNIIGLSKSLNLKVVAEGVEHEEQFNFLKAAGCDYFQGWYFGKPSLKPW